jgi:hypothetical protein
LLLLRCRWVWTRKVANFQDSGFVAVTLCDASTREKGEKLEEMRLPAAKA